MSSPDIKGIIGFHIQKMYLKRIIFCRPMEGGKNE